MKMVKLNFKMMEDAVLTFKGIIKRLVGNDDIEFIAQSQGGKDLLNQLTHSRTPQILTMDIIMNDLERINIPQTAEQNPPTLKILMLSIFDDDSKATEATFESIRNFVTSLSKEENASKSSNIVANPMEWEYSTSHPDATKTLSILRQLPNVAKSKTVDISYLTAREKDVLGLLTQGINVRQIGDKLFISPKTVRKHLEHIYEKLQVSGSKGAILKMLTGQ